MFTLENLVLVRGVAGKAAIFHSHAPNILSEFWAEATFWHCSVILLIPPVRRSMYVCIEGTVHEQADLGQEPNIPKVFRPAQSRK